MTRCGRGVSPALLRRDIKDAEEEEANDAADDCGEANEEVEEEDDTGEDANRDDGRPRAETDNNDFVGTRGRGGGALGEEATGTTPVAVIAEPRGSGVWRPPTNKSFICKSAMHC